MPPDLLKLQRMPHAVARWQKAQQELLGGRHGRAVAGYRDLVRHFPGVVQLWFELGMAAAGQLDFRMAEEAFRRAEELAMNDAASLVLIGQQYHRLRRVDRARACFELAVAAEPSSVPARLSLAAWYERAHRIDDAWACLAACPPGGVEAPQADCLRALLLHRQGRNSEAETLLRDIVRSAPKDVRVRCSSRHLLGEVLDELGQYQEALRWLTEAKAELRRVSNIAKLEQEYERAERFRRELLAALTPQAIQRWRQEGAEADTGARLALLAGHPRSGTTLLEQVLGAHPDVQAFDESEAFVLEVSEQLAPMQASHGLTPEALTSLPGARRLELRRRYFKSLLRETDGKAAARVLLDKNPGLTSALHLWLRLFPGSKVLVALRDPRDVVLSCFFQNLVLTSTNANFLSLDRAARHYAHMMDVWLRLRDLGGFDWLETRYEDLVANLEQEGRRVTEFLGLSWHANQANHREVGRRKLLFAPTYNDVTKPVHRGAVGRWQRYAEALAPVQEKLAPYCRSFGYG